MEEAITFEYIREAQRAEQKSQQLTNLPQDFFEKVKEYIQQKREHAKRNEDALLELKNIERIVEDIFNRRETKIVSLAVLSVRTGLIPANMLPHEEELFEQITKALRKSRFFLDSLLEKPLRKQTDYTKVEFLEDIEEFIGIDLKKFGPYNKGDKALIPKDNAELFIKAGKAKKVNE
ncbi:MAG: hypothetical protein KQA41_00175 [Candidatus Aenigmarchaeota archaeon]|nr:hypothetical protein [Candidatus Aenigmarchaeota archaeon]